MPHDLNIRNGITLGILFAFLANTFGPIPLAQAQDFRLPVPGVMVNLSPEFNPPIFKGIKVHSDNPFRFDFILDKGDSKLSNGQISDESSKLIKYFLASLTIPEKDLWVNLSPYEKNRIVPESFGETEMGRDLLAEDYMLKQITASLIYPEGETGKKFWKHIYEEAAKRFGTTNIPVNTFNKVWIVPEKAVVYENAHVGTAYVVESTLKVMLEQDYLSLQKHEGILAPIQGQETNQLGSQIVREIVIPELTKEVNEDKNFIRLRQVYNSLILATWYKKKIKDSILEQVYANQKKVAGVNVDDPQEIQRIYQRYLQAFKKGVYNYIKEDVDPGTQETVPRKYFSGGATFFELDHAMTITPVFDSAQVVQSDLAVVSSRFDAAMRTSNLPRVTQQDVVFSQPGFEKALENGQRLWLACQLPVRGAKEWQHPTKTIVVKEQEFVLVRKISAVHTVFTLDKKEFERLIPLMEGWELLEGLPKVTDDDISFSPQGFAAALEGAEAIWDDFKLRVGDAETWKQPTKTINVEGQDFILVRKRSVARKVFTLDKKEFERLASLMKGWELRENLPYTNLHDVVFTLDRFSAEVMNEHRLEDFRSELGDMSTWKEPAKTIVIGDKKFVLVRKRDAKRGFIAYALSRSLFRKMALLKGWKLREGILTEKLREAYHGKDGDVFFDLTKWLGKAFLRKGMVRQTFLLPNEENWDKNDYLKIGVGLTKVTVNVHKQGDDITLTFIGYRDDKENGRSQWNWDEKAGKFIYQPKQENPVITKLREAYSKDGDTTIDLTEWSGVYGTQYGRIRAAFLLPNGKRGWDPDETYLTIGRNFTKLEVRVHKEGNIITDTFVGYKGDRENGMSKWQWNGQEGKFVHYTYDIHLGAVDLREKIQDLVGEYKNILAQKQGPLDAEKGIDARAARIEGELLYLLRSQINLSVRSMGLSEKELALFEKGSRKASPRQMHRIVDVLREAYSKDGRLDVASVEETLRVVFPKSCYGLTRDELIASLDEMAARLDTGGMFGLMRQQVDMPVTEHISRVENGQRNLSKNFYEKLKNKLISLYRADGRLTELEVAHYMALIPPPKVKKERVETERPKVNTAVELWLKRTSDIKALTDEQRYQLWQQDQWEELAENFAPEINAILVQHIKESYLEVLLSASTEIVMDAIHEWSGEGSISSYVRQKLEGELGPTVRNSEDSTGDLSLFKYTGEKGGEKGELIDLIEGSMPLVFDSLPETIEGIAGSMDSYARDHKLPVVPVSEKEEMATGAGQWFARYGLNGMVERAGIRDAVIYMVDDTGRLGWAVKNQDPMKLVCLVDTSNQGAVTVLANNLYQLFGHQSSELMQGSILQLNFGRNGHFANAKKYGNGLVTLLQRHHLGGQLNGFVQIVFANVNDPIADRDGVAGISQRIFSGIEVWQSNPQARRRIRETPLLTSFSDQELLDSFEGFLVNQRLKMEQLVKMPVADQAQLSRPPHSGRNEGGIDFTASKTSLEIQNSGQGIKFHFDPATLQRFQNAPGLVPVIINIQPMTDLRRFLGLADKV